MKRSQAATTTMLTACLLIGLAGCRLMRTSEKKPDPEAMPDLTPTLLDYVDSDGFDALLETSLVSQDPIIIISTGRSKPDWKGRLNAWIAAWNHGADRPRAVRGQIGLPGVPINKDTVRELRLLVNDLLDRVEDTAHAGSTWWADQRQRKRRIALMQPYSMRFHIDDMGLIQLVFFHGNYALYYPRFMQTLTQASAPREAEWTRTIECSGCTAKQGKEVDGTLTGRSQKP